MSTTNISIAMSDYFKLLSDPEFTLGSNPDSNGHIHLDVRRKNLPEVRQKLIEAGLGPHDFTFDEGNTNLHMPDEHLSYFTKNPKEQMGFWNVIKEECIKLGVFGYLEEEWGIEQLLKDNPKFNENIKFPFKLKLKKLSSEFGPKFREQEVHFVFDADEVDPRLFETLHAAGMYSVLLVKPTHRLRVMTMQGTKLQLSQLIPPLISYLKSAGGYTKGEFIIETILDYQYLGGIMAEELPLVIDKIEFEA
ncbi:MAG: hypothetical protein OHK0017_01840 [Patescibacteria group bacterium]